MTIAKRRLIDYWRRKRRTDRVIASSSSEPDEPPDPTPGPLERLTDRDQEIRWVIQSFFRKHAPNCQALLASWLAEEPWQEVADRSGRGLAAVRREWQRCLERLRVSALNNPSSTLGEIRP